MWHEGSGRLVYDPNRGGMKRKKEWWAVVNVDREITRYYRWWIESQYHIKGLCQPSWDAHISIIRGEKPRQDLMHLWKKYDGRVFTFRYKHEPTCVTQPNEVGTFWTIEVDAPELLEIRKELQRPANWNLHLTVGRTWFK